MTYYIPNYSNTIINIVCYVGFSRDNELGIVIKHQQWRGISLEGTSNEVIVIATTIKTSMLLVMNFSDIRQTEPQGEYTSFLIQHFQNFNLSRYDN